MVAFKSFSSLVGRVRPLEPLRFGLVDSIPMSVFLLLSIANADKRAEDHKKMIKNSEANAIFLYALNYLFCIVL